jgi:hypothetical protein
VQGILNPPLKLEVTGSDPALKHAARHLFVPGKRIAYKPEESQSEVRICEGQRCLMPVTDVQTLEAQANLLKKRPTPTV